MDEQYVDGLESEHRRELILSHSVCYDKTSGIIDESETEVACHVVLQDRSTNH